ncbi:cyclic lactone autoinducer peptide [Paenibacillus sp. TRM 82003]|nr:cyclic lactone autoinducer peptide [Paenibacillus sp. TRM 82003]
MKNRIALVANVVFAAIATMVMTSASVLFFHRPEIPAELQRKH